MPLYEYRCPDCQSRFEKLVRLSDSDLRPPCPSCGSSRVDRAISTFAAFSSDGGQTRSLAGGCAGCSGGSCACCSLN